MVCDFYLQSSERSGLTLKDDAPKTSCPFTLHAQIHPVSVPEYLMQELEDELQNPTGISTVSTPKLSISGILLSKECGLLYEITNSEGLRCAIFLWSCYLAMLKTAKVSHFLPQGYHMYMSFQCSLESCH